MHVHGMQANAGASAASTPPARLVKAAHEFEGQLMEQLLKPMTDSDGLTGDTVTGSAGALGSFASAALGQALSQEGGLGLADQIIRTLTPHGQSGVTENGTETGEKRPGVTRFGNYGLEMSGNK